MAVGTGLQKSFSWSQVAAGAVVSGGFGALGSGSVPSNKFANTSDGLVTGTLRGIVGGVARQEVAMALGGHGKLDVANVAADAFGNALGNSIVGAIEGAPGQTQQQSNAQKGADVTVDANGDSVIYGNTIQPSGIDLNGIDVASGASYASGGIQVALNGSAAGQLNSDGSFTGTNGINIVPLVDDDQPDANVEALNAAQASGSPSSQPTELEKTTVRALGGLVGAGESVLSAGVGAVVLLGAGTGAALDKTGLFGDYFAPDREILDQAYSGITSFFNQDHPLDSVFTDVEKRLASGDSLSSSNSLLDQFNAGRTYGQLGGDGVLLVTGGADLALSTGRLTAGAVQLGRDISSLRSLDSFHFSLSLDDVGGKGPEFDLAGATSSDLVAPKPLISDLSTNVGPFGLTSRQVQLAGSIDGVPQQLGYLNFTPKNGYFSVDLYSINEAAQGNGLSAQLFQAAINDVGPARSRIIEGQPAFSNLSALRLNNNDVSATPWAKILDTLGYKTEYDPIYNVMTSTRR